MAPALHTWSAKAVRAEESTAAQEAAKFGARDPAVKPCQPRDTNTKNKIKWRWYHAILSGITFAYLPRERQQESSGWSASPG